MKKTLVVAPHPDDETLGCGGTIVKHRAARDAVHWIIVTHVSDEMFYMKKNCPQQEEIDKVAARYGFGKVHNLKLPISQLDLVPMADLIGSLSDVIREVQPEVLYVPYRGDIHTDHRIVFDAVASCTKWFRNESIRRVLAYETLSETDFGLNPDIKGFRPNVFVDITEYLETKVDILQIYKSEVSDFPFPRSEQAIRALAQLRGAAAGYKAAEAFMLLKERA